MANISDYEGVQKSITAVETYRQTIEHTFDKIRVAIRDEQDRLRTMDWPTDNNEFQVI